MVPDFLLPLFERCRAAGGRALLVGGTVRDALLGNPGKDLDIEVHRLTLAELVPLLRPLGHINEVGRAFGVLKLRASGVELDVSLPRRDSKEGVGHKGIRADSDPFIGISGAARRRDLTINAIAWDPLDRTYEDPFDGRGDLERRLLRCVDPHTFGEDPLRALRVAQFAARFGFEVDPALESLCATMPLDELPAERIRGEIEKLLTKGTAIAHGWTFAARTGLWARVVPEWQAVPDALERVATVPVPDEGRRLALLYAAANAGGSLEMATSVLDRLRVFRIGGFPVRRVVLSLLARRPVALQGLNDTIVRRLSEDADLDLLAALVDRPELEERARALGVWSRPLPVLLSGAELVGLGVQAGPKMGDLLSRLREAQLEGQLCSPADARAWVQSVGLTN